MNKPLVGITMGDAAGIGPEITLKALLIRETYQICRPVVYGDKGILDRIVKLYSLDMQINEVEDVERAGQSFGTVDVLNYNNVDQSDFEYGVLSARCGEAAVRYTIDAGKDALAGKIQAMVSAPLNKEAMRMAGYHYEGQTQILGELCGSKNYGMLLVLGEFRLMLYTTHMSLRDACNAVTYDGILSKLQLANDGMQFFNIKNPTIAVSALNPHAGEGGLFGDEEIKAIVPAIKTAQKNGINAVGPIPADTIFVKAKNGEYDLVIALYHDQGNTAMKLLGFGSVVTLLAGLPVIRTSTGHGTAFDIAGKNIAKHENIQKAIILAAQLGANRL